MAHTRGKPKKPVEIIDWTRVGHMDEDCQELRKYRLRDKLKDAAYEEKREAMVEVLTGSQFTVEYMQRTGFTKPVLVHRKDDLDMRVPDRDFTVDSVRSGIGSRRQVDVLEVKTQKSRTMCMKEFCKYWEAEPREEVLNGITTEISLTRLDSFLMAPRVVRQVDWIDKAWPRHLKELQEDSTNNIEQMMYPKVQKFVVMSVANSYMDFHVDFGGTSVWYYLLKGHKIFWLVPPTDENLLLYEKWVRNGSEAKSEFFGDLAEGCCRIEVAPGNTLFMPGGWIHAVFTPKDSIAFSGSFLHSFAFEKQLQVNFIEDSLGVLQKFRFPFFTELLWYVLDRYVTCLTGKSNLDLPDEEKRRLRLEKGEKIDPNKEFINPGLGDETPIVPREHVHLTVSELTGLKYVIMYLYRRPPQLRNVPVLIPDPAQLIKDVRDLILSHKADCPEAAVTGRYILRWTEDDNVDEDAKMRKIIPRPEDYKKRLPDNPFHKKYLKGADGKSQTVETPKRRRIRCLECEGCKTADCKACTQCRDMPKYGGPGRMKQTCVRRRCGRPLLPVAAACARCGLDGWNQTPDPKRPWTDKANNPPDLYECVICLEITHPKCVEVKGEVEAGLCNSWECGPCIAGGKSTKRKRTEEAGGVAAELAAGGVAAEAGATVEGGADEGVTAEAGAAMEGGADGGVAAGEDGPDGCVAAGEGGAEGCVAAEAGPAAGEGGADGCVAAGEGGADGCLAAEAGPAAGEGGADGCVAAGEGGADGCLAAEAETTGEDSQEKMET